MELTRESWTQTDYDAFAAYLKENADEKYKAFTMKLTPNTYDLYGVRVPLLRTFSKAIAKGNFREFLNFLPKMNHELILSYGFTAGMAKWSYDEMKACVDRVVPLLYNWAQVDMICNTIKDNRHFDDLEAYLTSPQEFVRRFGIIRMLSSYVCEEYVDRVLESALNVKCGEYYVDMALAWLYSVCYVKFPEKTQRIFPSLSPEVLKKTKQKIRDSFRVDRSRKSNL